MRQLLSFVLRTIRREDCFQRRSLERILKATPGLVFLDEAYHEFSGQTALTLLPANPNLIVLRTFSKAMSMAGLRFGYLMAHPEIAKEIHKAKLPYNVNVFTLAAAEMVLERPNLMKEVDSDADRRTRACARRAPDTPRRGSLRFMHEFLSHPNNEERP